jgi:hypothetical protein
MKTPSYSELAQALDYDVIAAGEFAVSLLECVNFHNAAGTLARVVARERKAFAKLAAAQHRHERRQRRAQARANSSPAILSGLPLFAR